MTQTQIQQTDEKNTHEATVHQFFTLWQNDFHFTPVILSSCCCMFTGFWFKPPFENKDELISMK